MQFQYTPYILPLIGSALISGGVAYYAWTRRSKSVSAIALAFLAIAAFQPLGFAAAERAITVIEQLELIGHHSVPLRRGSLTLNYSAVRRPGQSRPANRWCRGEIHSGLDRFGWARYL